MKQALHRYGIHRSFIFPDLEGLASHLSWLKFDKYKGCRGNRSSTFGLCGAISRWNEELQARVPTGR